MQILQQINLGLILHTLLFIFSTTRQSYLCITGQIRNTRPTFETFQRFPGAVIVTTEKDAVKLTNRAKIPEEIQRGIYYLPINISFIEDSATDFLQKLEEDVRGN